MPFSYIELENYTNLSFGMGPPGRGAGTAKWGIDILKRDPHFTS